MVTIYDVRIEKDLSQANLATLAGVSIPTIMRLENGQPVNKRSFFAVCAALEISPESVEDVKFHSAVQAAATRKRNKRAKQ